MKIISWNCRGKFRDKFSVIQKKNADIYVIQECENPEKYKKHFSNFFSDYVWYGERDSKGLGIFAQPNVKMEVNNWPVYCLRHFISVMLNPEIIKKDGAYDTEEGCLSLLGSPRKCKRYKTIKVQYQTLEMQTRTKNFTGWTAQIIQHEVDHCNGVLI